MPLFEDVKFYCAPSFPPERQAQIAVLLDANGATASPLDQATHIITNASEYEGYQNAKEGVAVVTDSWVDRSLILGKLQQPQYYSPDPAMLFSGVVASSTDIKSTDVEVLSAGITALGGQWKQGLTREVTHLFAACPGSDKYTTALHFQKDTRIKVLVPHWFDDSVRLGIRCLSTSAYEWPDPTALTSGRPPALDDDAARLQSKISGEKKSLFKAALMTTEQEAKLAHVEKRNVWEGRRLLLSSDLDLSDGRRLAVEAGILRSGGVVVEYNEDDEAVEMDVLICRYRSGDLYIQAMNERKLIGSLTWVFHVESTGSISPPSHQLLHYPIPKRPLEGFADHEITVTNYTGEAREYLKKLIVLMGATFTPSMSGKNTVLIAAYISGNKTTKAKNWSIPIVNHTWLEDCFVQWKNLTVGLEKYVVFPAGLDFSEHLVERGVPRAVIAEGLHELLAEIDLSKKSAFDGEGELPGGDGIAPQAPNARDADEGEEDNEIEIAPMDVDDFDDDDTSPLATAAPEDDGMELPGRGTGPPRSKREMPVEPEASDGEESALTKLGAKIAARPSDCTHLIVKSLGRTEKFLCAMAVAPHIVTEKWATASAAAQKFLPPEKYRVVDPENEKKFEFKLADALHRATQNKGRIFADMVFFVTPNVPVERKLLKNVVAAHGGQMRPQNPTVRALNGKSNYFVISCPEDASIWKPLADAGHPIYTKELLLNGALTQEIRWDDPSSRLS
ncbi:hypothetical protein BV25DRAFT_1813329 [Artomyces pyxidatus]|uniref:Uncharacterized protein n=1 Tax=Artomyces pyxidatus TaxID=48021 RepID=A0ACB8SMF6_9AGAM|nr:hypothetical protein BV25DRAFT_1813329 [Artomyces pyxidatus]